MLVERKNDNILVSTKKAEKNMVHAFIIEPLAYNAFENEANQLERCREWGLLTEKATKTKAFFYKGHGMNLACSIVGYVDKMTAVIEFDNEQRHCIHPSFLKEMQASGYSQRLLAAADETAESTESAETAELESAETEIPQQVVPVVDEVKAEEPKRNVEASAGKAKKEKAQKIELPEDKVKMTATVQEFTTVPNNFSDNEDEVIIYEAVSIMEPGIEIGAAWSSHSTTLKKLELAIGDTITFEAKIIKKKLTKHPVPYKINNPSKIQKSSAD
jgi:hypothetical protein